MEHNDLPNEDSSKESDAKKKEKTPPKLNDATRLTLARCKELNEKPGIYSVRQMAAAGLKYTGFQDTAMCKDCGFIASNWEIQKEPFAIHSEENPNCAFVRNVRFSALPRISTTTGLPSSSIASVETDAHQQARQRTFSHWRYGINSPFSTQIIKAGFFYCTFGDRVICLYCNLICQQWIPLKDDPREVHKTLAPNCPYVKEILMCSPTSSAPITNNNPTKTTLSNHLLTSTNLQSSSAAIHPDYAETSQRLTTFTTWSYESLPTAHDLARAGFFYTGRKNIVTCFYCNGSLQNFGPNDNPMIEHARWFPHCAYAKQLYDDELHRRIQEAQRAPQGRVGVNEAGDKASTGIVTTTNPIANGRQLLIPDESTLSRLVAARLDLSISHDLSKRNFSLDIIKRCWENQLRLKKEDFESEYDLYLACTIIKRQNDYIDGKAENITIPSIKMKQIREQNEECTAEQSPTAVDATPSAPKNPCVLCLTEEKRLAFIPCGHLATCVACGHSLQSCPMCRREIEAFVRIYI